MLRIHFTEADLGKTRVARAPDPLWELVLSVHKLADPRPGTVFGDWRERALTEVRERRLGGALAHVGELVPRAGYFPDFLTPPDTPASLAEGLDAVCRTPRSRLRRDLAYAAKRRRLAPWTADLARGDRRVLGDVAEAFRLFHDAALAPEWDRVAESVISDAARRAHAFHDEGVHGLLGSLRPTLRWEPPVLSADYPARYGVLDIRLDGRGLRLIPSYFCWRTPVALVDPELPPTVVYPVERPRSHAPDRAAALAAAIGRPRARTLLALAVPATTGELAARLGTSAASASEHTSALRTAGLVTSHRVGRTVLHSRTRLGTALAEGGF